MIITDIAGPFIEPLSGQNVLRVTARVTAGEDLYAEVRYHMGYDRDTIYTGYAGRRLRDNYTVYLGDGRVFRASLYREDDPDLITSPAGHAMARAWHGVAPVRTTVWWALSARLLRLLPDHKGAIIGPPGSS